MLFGSIVELTSPTEELANLAMPTSTATLGHSSGSEREVQMTATATHPGGAPPRFSLELQEISR